IEANRVVGARDVIVDRGRNQHHGHSAFARKGAGGAKTAVTTDNDQPIDSSIGEVFGGARPRSLHRELRRARGLENRAAALDYVRDCTVGERLEIPVNQTLETALDTYHLEARATSRADNRARRGVHPGRVAASS